MGDLVNGPDLAAIDESHKKWREKHEAFREVLMKWERHELRDVITDALYDAESMVDLILENGYLDDEMDKILLEAGRVDEDGELVRLCGGVKTSAEEHALYKRVMNGE